MIKPILAKFVYEPLKYGIFLQDSGLNYFRFLKKSQWNSFSENREIQNRLLFNMLKYCQGNIPYYQKIFQENDININQANVNENLVRIPILTKEIIRKEFTNLYRNKNVKYYFNASGGSTGEPIKLIQDKQFGVKMAQVKKLQKEWTGFKTGDILMKLWGSEQDIIKAKGSLKSKIVYWMNSSYLLNSFLLDEQKMQTYVALINKKKPRLIVAYVQSIYELAKFIEINNLEVYSPTSIMTSAGVLHSSIRKVIERNFRCPVFNRYGSREVGPIASECEIHDGLHISIFTHYIEILDHNMQPCKEGETGEIYVTLLTNYTMPLIRYKIGDMAVYTEKICNCGRGLPLIKNIVGRDVDLFINSKNELIDGEYFTHMFYFRDYIKKFQIIQKSKKLVLLKIVLNSKEDIKLFENDLGDFNTKIRLVMGTECETKYNIVNEIKPSSSGKYRYTIRQF